MTADILILSNGPGEVTTWVRPVVKQLRKQLGNDREQIRISVILSPCPNSSGKEAEIARSFPEVDRVQAAEYFWNFLLWGKTLENWEWSKCGVVVFLGGDQIFPAIIGRRLGYRTVVYAEWEARWYNWIDRFGVMKPEVANRIPSKYTHKFTVIGDLMAEAQGQENNEEKVELSSSTPTLLLPCSSALFPSSSLELIGLLPGSKAAKLTQGVPFMLAVAEYVKVKRPQSQFIIPVAPTLDIETLASFADPQKNNFVRIFGSSSASLNAISNTQSLPNLKTETGLRVELHTETPAYSILSKCSICLTTVGANTAELGSLAVPMIVLLPTQQLDAMRSWDGLPGLLANMPLLGSSFAKLINWLVLRRLGLLAWPNIWAKEMVVPELVGKLQPQEVGEMVIDFLNHPEKLEKIRARLRSIRGEAGAAQKLAKLVKEELNEL
ncbi:lipid-A-disaccharide synthase [Scytonema sp. NUACC26]|uniref:lipid-A-disaccharide synthase n=1 Tax=Scytonema sp. NUACC26 TaxID=3140176 RepID=UPI0034DC5137